MGDSHGRHPLKNWLVSAWLSTPLCGDPPQLDAVLQWEMANRLGLKHAKKTGRWTPPDEIEDVPISLAKRTVNGRDIHCCSSPIIPPLYAQEAGYIEKIPSEWVDHTGKRFESAKMAGIIAPEYRKSVLTASGPYKQRFVPERVRLVPRVCWFLRGDREGINKLLIRIYALGRHRSIGYGAVWKWTFDEVANDYSIFTPCNGKIILMRILPVGEDLNNVCGYRLSFGGYRAPYWHPAYQTEVAVPC